ncbi:MAG: hypothetical protein JXR37_25575 [Kiritimatiellae bacterium]|nr:hypothetical protein [Kiritimatiellia bacterium]
MRTIVTLLIATALLGAAATGYAGEKKQTRTNDGKKTQSGDCVREQQQLKPDGADQTQTQIKDKTRTRTQTRDCESCDQTQTQIKDKTRTRTQTKDCESCDQTQTRVQDGSRTQTKDQTQTGK